MTTINPVVTPQPTTFRANPTKTFKINIPNNAYKDCYHLKEMRKTDPENFKFLNRMILNDTIQEFRLKLNFKIKNILEKFNVKM